jgi:hypothetical protein
MPVRSNLLTPEDELVGDKVAAEILGLSNFRTLSNWRANNQHPDLAYLRIGRSIRYRVGDLLDFRRRHTVGGVKAVESAIEHAANAASAQLKAPSQHLASPPIAIAVKATQVLSPETAQVMQLQKAPGHVVRPSELICKQLSL